MLACLPDSQGETYYTLEKKPLIVDSFVKWRVADIERFTLARRLMSVVLSGCCKSVLTKVYVTKSAGVRCTKSFRPA